MSRTVKEINWQNYLFKAKQFKNTADDAYVKRSWNSVGLNAVHSAISANDALVVYHTNLRSTSDNHHDAVNLLIKALNNEDDARSNAKHVSWLINRKNLIEYESRLFYENEANEALKHADRFLTWVAGRLPK